MPTTDVSAFSAERDAPPQLDVTNNDVDECDPRLCAQIREAARALARVVVPKSMFTDRIVGGRMN
jgi:hypothetical protein